ncbi:PilX N-terminal domain-containing pilus assembly protein [Candidatus Poribacteria bacterium]
MIDTNPTSNAALRNESGAALLLTLMLMLVLSLLTVSLYELLQTSSQITGNHRRELKTTYIADAGVEDAINILRSNPYEIAQTFPVVSFGNGEYEVTILSNEPVDAGILRGVDIRSVGTLSGFRRAIEAHIQIVDAGELGYKASITSWEFVPPPPS